MQPTTHAAGRVYTTTQQMDKRSASKLVMKTCENQMQLVMHERGSSITVMPLPPLALSKTD